MKLLDELKAYENTNWLNDTISKISKWSGVIIYGAATNGVNAANVLIENNINVSCFCDDDEQKLNKKIQGLETISLKEAMRKFSKDALVLVCSCTYFEKMVTNCLEMGFKNIMPFVQLVFFYETISTLSKIENELEKIYNLLADEKSKELFKCLLIARISGDISRLANLADSCQYFDPKIVKLTETEVFVDCGAYDGDTIAEFVRRTKGKYHSVYGFEMDEQNADSLEENTCGFENVFTVRQGCYNKNGIVNFLPGLGGNSNINENGEALAKVCRLDDFMKDKAHPTFIKMDIEGAELSALQGAEFIIRNYKPLLAICLYHKPNDIWEIPLYIKSLCPEYKLYIRAYSTIPTEYVLYAVV
ncbi:MAG: FkbM family methyltransferase [Syntrophomonadaceae bacterium]|jgi:FkbM family methyltransferase|nr:FkbM family methyltransferase [Syntrophomonadaceae bacterium]